MRNLFTTFFTFFKNCSTKEKWFFYLGALASFFAGISEAFLFKYLSELLNDLALLTISLTTVMLVISGRFLWVYASVYLISIGSATVTSSMMKYFIRVNYSSLEKDKSQNIIPQVINESERIGMGYYLAWQNILSNFLQLSALIFAAAILISREFFLVMAVIVPIYFSFSSITSVMVSKLGLTRMETLRKLSSCLSNNSIMDSLEVSNLVNPIIASIFKVRIWSLIQKPSLEMMGLFGVGVSMYIDVYFLALKPSEVIMSYVLITTIFIRLLPYVNQIQNGFTLAASVHHEVKSFNDENTQSVLYTVR